MTGTGPTVRLLRLLDLLQSRQVWAGPELAERLGVTTRSIRRDVDRLRELGYPVNAEQGAGGGYRLGAGRKLTPLLLDDDEAVAVAVCLRLAAGGTVAGVGESAVRTLAKLDQVLPARLRVQVDAIHRATVTLEGGSPRVDGKTLLGLARAIRESERVSFSYTGPRGTGDRRAEPYRLVATGRRWYLLAFDLDRDDWRTFRLDRISDVATPGWRFSPRTAPDPADYVTRSISASAYAYVARVRINAPRSSVAELIPPISATLTADGRWHCILETGADDLGELARQLGLLPWELTILEPPELRAAIRSQAERLLRLSADPGGRGEPDAADPTDDSAQRTGSYRGDLGGWWSE